MCLRLGRLRRGRWREAMRRAAGPRQVCGLILHPTTHTMGARLLIGWSRVGGLRVVVLRVGLVREGIWGLLLSWAVRAASHVWQAVVSPPGT